MFGAKGEESKINKAKKSGDPLRNTPEGVTLSRLYYPPNKSEIVLVGLKRKTIIHSSYIYGMLVHIHPVINVYRLVTIDET